MLRKQGLPKKWIPVIEQHIKALKILGAEQIWLIGSRANGNHKEDSDFDYTTEPKMIMYSKNVDVIPNFRGKKIRIL